ncbi:phosphocholine cytidylyltransferase family protein [Yinghuangia seranimata]|uniref:phosphocholine cytidylyltransferase family protein n=1 Tax=Yinghuangia seranimata TaxID=408067 RepID=UPI00248CCF89|nr:phosphocholine cytidylyltransferase family protein [Yinghuangia seranimata]MDI2131717.1 phosphocholine cytidylyltransferase family protein [Yinghuangia seranimata]
MIGLILAAGAGRRLRPWTDTLPKALVPVRDERSVVDFTLENYAKVGLTEAAIVVGYCGDAVRERKASLERAYGVKLHLVDNDKAEEWNNAYSLWCARDYLAEGVLLANGDTLHPVTVQEALLAARDDAKGIILALDDAKPLAEEEMKVRLSAEGGVARITKLMEPAEAVGEYIGVTLIEGRSAAALVDALETTWRRDPNLYYEDGYQEMADRGLRIDVQSIGGAVWTEIDTTEDLMKAREIACRY